MSFAFVLLLFDAEGEPSESVGRVLLDCCFELQDALLIVGSVSITRDEGNVTDRFTSKNEDSIPPCNICILFTASIPALPAPTTYGFPS